MYKVNNITIESILHSKQKVTSATLAADTYTVHMWQNLEFLLLITLMCMCLLLLLEISFLNC